MLDTIFNLPVHALIVHATVILVPTTALLVALAAVVPRFRAWIGPIPPIAAVICVVLVKLTTMSGQELFDRLKRLGVDDKLIKEHKDLAGLLIWLVIPLALAAIAAYLLSRRPDTGKAITAAVAVLAVGLSGAVLVDVALIGHSGSKAVWHDTVKASNDK